MAQKLVFLADNYFSEEMIEYKYYNGFALSQKQKSIASLHEAIKEKHPDSKILEVSSKSTEPVGVALSAFNLMFYHEEIKEERHLENVFQSSKKFEHGGPFLDLLNVKPGDAKTDERLRSSGELVSFQLYGEEWPLEPKTLFYDWIYIKALSKEKELCKRILEYDIFTDIVFNQKKSINCQARAAAIFVGLSRNGKLEEKLASKEAFTSIYKRYIR